MNRRAFARKLVAGVAGLAWWKPRGLGVKWYELPKPLKGGPPLGRHMAVYKHAFNPRDYQGEWRFVVFHERKL